MLYSLEKDNVCQVAIDHVPVIRMAAVGLAAEHNATQNGETLRRA